MRNAVTYDRVSSLFRMPRRLALRAFHRSDSMPRPPGGDAPEISVQVNAEYVKAQLSGDIHQKDVRKYIL